jgi:hypothetical protein
LGHEIISALKQLVSQLSHDYIAIGHRLQIEKVEHHSSAQPLLSTHIAFFTVFTGY